MIELKSVPLRKLSAAQRASGNKIQKPIKVAMFPRYIFLAEPDIRSDWDEILDQSGIAGFACADNRMARIPHEQIEKLKRQENGGLIDGKKSVRVIFEVGEEINITSGPFASFPALVEKGLDVPISDLDPETRLGVLVNIFGRLTRTDLEIWQVAKH